MRECYNPNKIEELSLPMANIGKMELQRRRACLVNALHWEVERATSLFKQELSEHLCSLLRKDY